MFEMLKKLLNFLGILAIGVIGGMLWQTVFLPYLSESPYCQDWWFVRDFKERKVILYPREEIIIQENEALTKAIEKTEGAVIGIQTKTNRGAVIEGSGLILTSDGLIVTLAELVPRGSSFSFWLDGEKINFEIVKRDLKENLAIVKLNKQGLQTCGFSNLEKIKKGQRVFLIGAVFQEDGAEKTVNQGIIKRFDSNFIKTNIIEGKSLKGSPLFDIEGNVLGLNTVGLDNEVITIPISKIQDFASF